MTSDSERAAGEDGTPTPGVRPEDFERAGWVRYGFTKALYQRAAELGRRLTPDEYATMLQEWSVAAPRAGGAAEPSDDACDCPTMDAREILCRVFDDPDEAFDEWEVFDKSGWFHPSRALGAFLRIRLDRSRPASPVGATSAPAKAGYSAVSGTSEIPTSAPASEPTTEADGVRYFAEACVEAARKLGNDNGLDTKLNATAALLGEYARRLASQASALAAAEQDAARLDAISKPGASTRCYMMATENRADPPMVRVAAATVPHGPHHSRTSERCTLRAAIDAASTHTRETDHA